MPYGLSTGAGQGSSGTGKFRDPYWQLLQHAKDVALGFLQNKNDFSVRAKNIIEKKYDAKNRNMTTFAKLRESLDSPKTTENEFLC